MNKGAKVIIDGDEYFLLINEITNELSLFSEDHNRIINLTTIFQVIKKLIDNE